jgi:uncharacterized Zn-binding protein involved in type VI secretion
MPPAARAGDLTDHPGVISPNGAVLSVLIGKRPAAVADPLRGTVHQCFLPPSAGGPHDPTPVVTGSASVMIGGKPAARLGDKTRCGATIIVGAFNVLIGG